METTDKCDKLTMSCSSDQIQSQLCHTHIDIYLLEVQLLHFCVITLVKVLSLQRNFLQL